MVAVANGNVVVIYIKMPREKCRHSDDYLRATSVPKQQFSTVFLRKRRHWLKGPLSHDHNTGG